MNTKLARAELIMNLGWMGVDAVWMLEWYLAALVFVPLTLIYGGLTFLYTDRDPDSLCITTAMVAWGVMTCTWFAHDVGWWPPGKTVATVCVALGFAALVTVRVRGLLGHDTARAAFDRFRRLRRPRR